MKNKLTRIICSIAICLALSIGLIPTTIGVVSAEGPSITPATVGETTKLSGIASAKKQGEVLDVPDVTGLEKGTDYTIVAKNPRGVDISANISGQRLLLSDIGVYTITYNFNDATETSYTYQVKVSGSYASLSFENNTKAILPSKIKNSFTGKIYLPMPTVLDSEGNVFEGLNVTVTVYKASTSYKGITITSETTQEDMFFTLDNEYAGDYVITYKVKDDTNTYTLTTKTYTVNASATADASYELSASFSTTAPTTAVVGTAKTLPLVETVNKKTNNAVSSYYKVQALYLGTDYKAGDEKTDVTAKVISESNIFTANEPGEYEIKYTVYDVYGNSVDTLTFNIKDVKDSVLPTIKVVEPYTYDSTGAPTTKDAVNKLPSVWGNSDIVIPAIFAEDNYSTLYTDFTFTRYIMNNAGEILITVTGNANKNLVINTSGSASVSTSDFINVKTLEGYSDFTLPAGSYKVYYKAVDKAGNEKEQYYSMKIQADFFDDTTPTVKYNSTFPSTIVAGETFKFDAPIVSDENDKRVDVIVKYTFGELDGSSNIIYYTLEEKDGAFEIKVPTTIADKKTLKIVTTAIDDNGYVNGTATIVEKTMVVRNVTDTVIPTLTTVDDIGDIDGAKNQKDKVMLPEITFADNYVSNLNVDILVSYEKDDKVQYVNVYDKSVVMTKDEVAGVKQDSGSYSVTGAYFYADRITDYKITYIAKDAGNNAVIKSFIYSKNNITATVAPKLEGLTNLPTALTSETLELGEKITLPTPVIKDSNGDTIADSDYQVIVVSGPANYAFDYDYAYFTPKAVGTYYLRYVAEVQGETLTSKDYKVEVSDTTKPTINVDSNVDMPTTLALNANVNIPTFSVEDASEINESKCYIKITSSKSSTRTIYLTAAASTYTYTFAYNTSYTITYYAEDIYNNSSTKTFTVKVGDVQAPELTMSDETNVPTKVKLNDEFTVNLDKFTVYDAIDTELDKNDIKVVVTNTDTNKTVENLDASNDTLSYRYKFTTVGNYSISYKVTDSAGNTSEALTYTFTVTDDANGSSLDVTQVVGIILIVVACLVIAGVVVYFVVSQRKIKKIKNNIKK